MTDRDYGAVVVVSAFWAACLAAVLGTGVLVWRWRKGR